MSKLYYANSPLHNLPAGTMTIVRFASLVGVPVNTIMLHIAPGIDGDRIEITKVMWQCRLCRYLTPEQQQAALAFWKRHGVKHNKSGVAL